jgi:hypothetical protein
VQKPLVCRLSCCNKGRTQHLADLTYGIQASVGYSTLGRQSPIRGIPTYICFTTRARLRIVNRPGGLLRDRSRECGAGQGELRQIASVS